MANSLTISAAHFRQRRSQAGFTLIEVMVVMVIFAVLSSLLVVSFQRNGDRNARIECERFVAVVNEVRDESIVSGKTFILTIDEKAKMYQFSVLGGSPVQAGVDKLIEPRQVHNEVKLKWRIFEQFDEEEEDSEPRVIISSLGEMTEFEVRFGGEDQDYLVFINENGLLQAKEQRSNFF